MRASPASARTGLHGLALRLFGQQPADGVMPAPGTSSHATGSMSYAAWGPASPGAVESPPPSMHAIMPPAPHEAVAELHARLQTAEQVLAAFEQHRKNVQHLLYTQMSNAEHPLVREQLGAALAELQRDPKYLLPYKYAAVHAGPLRMQACAFSTP